MSQTPIDWDTDLPVDPNEEYRALVRALRRTQGFGLLFVRCSLAEGEHIIERVRQDLSQKNMAVLQFDQPIADGNFYREVENFLQNRGEVNVLFIRGLEHSLLDYEETKKRLSGWSSQEVYAYSWKGVPRILTNLNQQRERFRDTFKVCFVFLVPPFVFKYLIERAPDFFDWRSGVFEFPMESEQLQRESWQVYFNSLKQEDYQKLSPQERRAKILELQNLIDENRQLSESKADLYFDQALLFGLNGEYEVAIAVYDRSLKLDPNRTPAWTGRGNALSALGRDREASESYGKAAQLKQDLHNQAIKASNPERDEETLMILDAPDHGDWSNLGIEISNLGNSEAVISGLSEASESKLGDPIFFLDRGVELHKLNRYAEAIEFYDKALKLKPDDDEAWNNRGSALYDLGRYEEAIASYDKAVEIKKNYYLAWSKRGSALRALGRYEEAIASYDQAIQFKPDFHEAWNNRSSALRALGRYEEAIASYDQAIQFKPDFHEAWNNRGNALSAIGHYEEAIASYDQAIQFKPDSHEAWNNRGNALSAIGHYEEAIASYNQAIQFKPDYHEVWNNRGNALSAIGHYEEAIASYNQAIQFKPDYHEVWNNRGNALSAIGHYEEAIASYNQAIQFKPDYHEAWYNRGFYLMDLGRYEEAISSYDKSLEFLPEDAETYYNKARCYGLQGNVEQAIDSLQRAIELDPKRREMAQTDTDFDSIRESDAFQALVEGS